MTVNVDLGTVDFTRSETLVEKICATLGLDAQKIRRIILELSPGEPVQVFIESYDQQEEVEDQVSQAVRQMAPEDWQIKAGRSVTSSPP